MLTAAPKGIAEIIKPTSYRNGFFSINLFSSTKLIGVENVWRKMSNIVKADIIASLPNTQCLMFSVLFVQ